MFGQKNFTDQIERLAQATGLQIETESEELVSIPYEMEDGGQQTVWVEALDEDEAGNMIISIYSLALNLTESNLTLDEALELLRENGTHHHGAWAIDEVEGEEHLMMVDTMILETADPKAFRASVEYVAYYTDEFEAEYDKDEF